MHPLQSFSGVAVPSLDGKVFAIEGDPLAVRCARQIVVLSVEFPCRLMAAQAAVSRCCCFCSWSRMAIEEASVQLLMLAGMKRAEAIRALLH